MERNRHIVLVSGIASIILCCTLSGFTFNNIYQDQLNMVRQIIQGENPAGPGSDPASNMFSWTSSLLGNSNADNSGAANSSGGNSAGQSANDGARNNWFGWLFGNADPATGASDGGHDGPTSNAGNATGTSSNSSAPNSGGQAGQPGSSNGSSPENSQPGSPNPSSGSRQELSVPDNKPTPAPSDNSQSSSPGAAQPSPQPGSHSGTQPSTQPGSEPASQPSTQPSTQPADKPSAPKNKVWVEPVIETRTVQPTTGTLYCGGVNNGSEYGTCTLSWHGTYDVAYQHWYDHWQDYVMRRMQEEAAKGLVYVCDHVHDDCKWVPDPAYTEEVVVKEGYWKEV